MRRSILLGILIAAFATGLGLNVYTVVRSEAAIALENTWRFRISGFDPYDPFSGRYIEFRVDALRRLETIDGVDLAAGIPDDTRVYLSLASDEAGYAYVAGLSISKPAREGGWLTVRHQKGGALEPVFTRYYVNALRAPALEREFLRKSGKAYITVKIARGVGVITGLYFEE